mgnify:CR=1 FL=1
MHADLCVRRGMRPAHPPTRPAPHPRVLPTTFLLWVVSTFLPTHHPPAVPTPPQLAPLLANRILVAKYTFLGSPATNYWRLPVYDGDWGNDYVLGAAIMKGFWISNFLKDAGGGCACADGRGCVLSS